LRVYVRARARVCFYRSEREREQGVSHENISLFIVEHIYNRG